MRFAAPPELPARFRGGSSAELTPDQRAILSYAHANSGSAPITLAVEGGALATAAYLVHSDATIIGMGGFSGQDPAPTPATLAQWAQQGQLRYVLIAGRDGPGRGSSGPAGRGGGLSAQRTQWVQQHCAAVNALRTSDRAGTLYDCQAPHL